MFIFLLVSAIVFVYLIVGGMAGAFSQKALGASNFWDHPGPFFTTVLWPLVVPAYAGVWASKLMLDPDKRQENRHERELAEARHRTALIEEEAKQTRILEESLR